MLYAYGAIFALGFSLMGLIMGLARGYHDTYNLSSEGKYTYLLFEYDNPPLPYSQTEPGFD